MNALTFQRLLVWSGVPCILLFFGGFLLAHFVPPLTPAYSQEHVVAHYQQYQTGILAGGVLMLISGMFYATLTAGISTQLKTIPGLMPGAVYAQLCTGTAGVAFFMLPAVLFIVTAYRPDRNPDITFMLNDFAWIIAVIPWPTFFMQNLIIGVAIFADKRSKPLLPRWLGYFNFWVALGFLPGGLLPFFKQGAFAWSGLLVFWLAGSVFTAWFIVMTTMLLRGIARRERGEVA